MSELAKKIEALLFVGGEGMTISRLATALKKSDAEIKKALEELEAHLEESHALALLKDEDHVSLVTGGEVSKIVEDFAWSLLGLSVEGIITGLDLREPIYQSTAALFPKCCTQPGGEYSSRKPTRSQSVLLSAGPAYTIRWDRQTS